MDPSLRISEKARDFLLNLLERQKVEGIAARLFITNPGTPRAETCLAYCRPGEEKAGDKRLVVGDLVLFLDKASLPYMDDLELDLQEDDRAPRLTIKAPNAKAPRQGSDVVVVEYDCPAKMVPSGDPITLPAGTSLRITQALGGSYTLLYEGNMVRVDGEDAVVLGLSANELRFEAPADGRISEDQIWSALSTVYDPEIPVDIVNLGLVYQLQVDQQRGHVDVEMTLTAPGCGMGEVLVDDVRTRLKKVPHINSSNVELVFDPPWHREMMSEEARLETGLY